MVFKISKGGVRTGNTLRGLQSNRTKRYSRHACLLGSTSLGRRDLRRLIGDGNDDDDDTQMVKETLNKTDVLLSLNKHQRWRLPAMIGHMINRGHFNKGAVVSLLEKHKLKRRANCVKLVTNSKKTKNVSPKQKKYFSFNLDTVCEDKSNRQKKKAQSDKIKQMTRDKVSRSSNGFFSTVEAFTSTGNPPPETSSLQSDKPEYRVEVFYPCPPSCSLTYNPKYTDVTVVQGTSGKLEVKSNVKTRKKGASKHRKRLLLKDVSRLHSEAIQDDVDDLWNESDDEWVDEDEDTNNNSDDDKASLKPSSSFAIDDSVIALLVEQAQIAREMCINKPQGSSRRLNKSSEPVQPGHKSHVVFDEDVVHEKDRYFAHHDYTLVRRKRHNKNKKKTEINTITTTTTTDNKNNNNNNNIATTTTTTTTTSPNNSNNQSKTTPTNTTTTTTDTTTNEQTNDTPSTDVETDTYKTPCLDCAKVILANSQVVPEELRQVYGRRYAEASCLPRRFVLDVTEDVANLLGSSKASSTHRREFSSYLVCIHDGFYDEGLAVYKIAFNSVLNLSLNNVLPFAQTSFPEIMNALTSHILDLKESNSIGCTRTSPKYNANNNGNVVNSRINLKVEVVDDCDKGKGVIEDEVDILSNPEIVDECLQMERAIDFDEEQFCDVCYESVTASKLDSVPGTKLRPCGHLLCNECWATHFRTSTKNGKTKMSCAGYDCDNTVGTVTLMSILDISEINLIKKRQAEETFDKMDNARYCPHPNCGRIIIVESQTEDLCVDVACACGNKICFSCFGPAHWPARCGQAEEYIDRIPEIKPAKEATDDDDDDDATTTALSPHISVSPKEPQMMTVEGRICPMCRRFIYKAGGCTHLVCTCGHALCWTCMKPYHAWYPCKPDPFWLHRHCRVVLVKHATPNRIVPLDAERKDRDNPHSTKTSGGHKASLYQKALHQRHENLHSGKLKTKGMMMPLVWKMATATRQDSDFKREVAKCLLTDFQLDDVQALADLDLTSDLQRFIKSTANMKAQLHHVCEYTFILLQGTPHGVAKQRILKLANDLTGFCSFVRSILSIGDKQDVKAAFRRLLSLRVWALRALDALIRSSHELRKEEVTR